MNRKRFVIGGVSSAAVGAALATDACSSGGLNPFHGGIENALRGETAGGYTIYCQYQTSVIAGYKLKTRTYNGKTVGPTLTIRPGQPLMVNIVNNLPPNPPEKPPKGGFVEIPDAKTPMEAMYPEHLPSRRVPADEMDAMNDPHGFNSTNLHVHGIQTKPHLFEPVGTSDPMARMIVIDPGTSYQYNLPVPANHPSGLHWYHPHKHGSTDVQVSGGMAGLIVVRGPIDQVPEIKAAREIFFVVQTLNVNPSKTEPGLYEREYIAYKPKKEGGYGLSTQFTMLTVASSDAGGPTNVNGIYWIDNSGMTSTYKKLQTPRFVVRPGEVVRLRLLNGCNGIPLALALPGFGAWQIGFDGVNLLEARQKNMSGEGVTTVTGETMFSAPMRLAMEANRIELLLKAPKTPGTYTFSSLATEGIDFSPFPQLDLAEFIVAGDPVKMGIPTTLPVPVREYPVITDADLNGPPRTFTFSQGPSNEILTGFAFKVNDALYNMMATPTTVRRGTCEEWILENSTEEAHPFHIHMVSFQLVEINGKKNDPIEIWDTFPIPPKINGVNGQIKIRLRFLSFTGKEVFHCHILPHEDTGMMQNFLVTG